MNEIYKVKSEMEGFVSTIQAADGWDPKRDEALTARFSFRVLIIGSHLICKSPTREPCEESLWLKHWLC